MVVVNEDDKITLLVVGKDQDETTDVNAAELFYIMSKVLVMLNAFRP